MQAAVNFVVMLIIMFVIGYLTMTVLIDRNILFHFNKVYGSLYMVLWMGAASALMEFAMPSTHGGGGDGAAAKTWLMVSLAFVVAAVAMTYVIKQQLTIDEPQFLRSMIEHHEMAVVMGGRILEKPNVSDETQELARNIIKTQTTEIAQMYQTLKRIE
jgi:hypothetical protein